MIQTVNLTKQKAIDSIKKEQVPVIIFGAGVVAEALFYACIEKKIKVECFCDNNINKTKSSLCNLRVKYVADLKTKYKDVMFLISVADIKDVIEQLKSLGFYQWRAASSFLRNFDISQYKFSAPSDFVEYALATTLLCQDSYFEPDKLFLRSVDIIITERCSLKCRDCSNLMQYYENPQNCDTGDLLKSIDRFLDIVDEVNEFRVIGGEPFMNQDFDLTIKRLVAEPKVKKILIYTNGTIIPKDEKIECLKSNKILLMISDYGKLSRNLNTLTQKLSSNNIAFYVLKIQGWTDCSKIIKHNRPMEQNKEILRNCCVKNVITLSKGKLYRCPFSANVDRLLAVPGYENDFIDIFPQKRESKDINEIRTKIKEFISNRDFLKICDYCSGRPFNAPQIEPHIQISKPLDYERKREN